MEQDLTAETELVPDENVCANCGDPNIVAGHATKLCADCRKKFINYPIPLGVKLFGAVVLIIMLGSAIWSPGNFSAALALAKAEKAEKNHEYVTEQLQLEKARKIAPGSVDILGHLMIASFNNLDFETLSSAFEAIKQKNITDSALYNELNYIMEEVQNYNPSDSFQVAFKKYGTGKIPDTAYVAYLKNHPEDLYARYSLANDYYEEKQYAQSDAATSAILNIQSDFVPALNLKTAVKRELSQTDSSIYFCDRLLASNHQSTYAMSSKARSLLKAGQYAKALHLAQQCEELPQQDTYNKVTLALAYHYNKDFQKRDMLVKEAQKDSASRERMKYATDIIAQTK